MSTLDLPRPAVVPFSVTGLLFATVALVVYADATRVGATSFAERCANPPTSARTVPTQPPTARFSLTVAPAHRLVPRGAAATYRVSVVRAPGFRERVELRVSKLPPGATATWTSSGLRVATSASQRLGSSRLVVSGTSRVGGRAIRRCSVAVLRVVESPPFAIGGGRLAAPLYPGGRGRLNLVLTNPNSFTLRVRALTVRVRADTTRPDCQGDVNYAVAQYSGRYPLVLRPGRTRLGALVGDSSFWPLVRMHDLPTNQDACKRAVLALAYSGLATR
jgi:hypothetical protein